MLCLVAQLCLTLCDPTDCRQAGSSVHGDSPGKNTGVGCHALLQGIFPTQGSNQVSCTASGFFTVWATSEAHCYNKAIRIIYSRCHGNIHNTILTVKNNDCQAKTVFLSIKKQLNSKHSFPLFYSAFKKSLIAWINLHDTWKWLTYSFQRLT